MNSRDADAHAGLQTIMSTSGHVFWAMLSRNSHVWMESNRRGEMAARQREADQKRKSEALREQEAAVLQLPVVQ